MKRLLLYVHFNKNEVISGHVHYQLEHIRSLFAKVVFISNSLLSEVEVKKLRQEGLIDEFIQRENIGYDFAAWQDGMKLVGFENLKDYDSVTAMNDTCFGPLWDLTPLYDRYESDVATDFWGMTNHRAIDAGHIYIDEHLQSYFMSFKQSIVQSDVFENFWQTVVAHTDVQKVIDEYETKYTKLFVEAGFRYNSVLNTVPIADQYFHSNFTIHYPHVLLDQQVPFIKVKTFDLTQHLSPYTLRTIEEKTNYPVQLIEEHMSDISLPTPAYLIDRKVIDGKATGEIAVTTKKVAVHLHTFYVDLLDEFLTNFEAFAFDYDLYLTTNTAEKEEQIKEILEKRGKTATIIVTGAKGRDIIPMLKLKDALSQYDYIGHFHTKKSPEYPYWVGDSWRAELNQMLIQSANHLLAAFDRREKLGLAIADIPSFFRYTKIVEPWNEYRFAADMNDLWKRMGLARSIDFETFDTFIMSYGTFIWFKYDALKPLFDLGLTDEEIPAEPLPQHTILHSIERILVYLAWANHYDYVISKHERYISPFVDNKVLNIRADNVPNTYINFDQIGGIKGALKYIYRGPGSAIKYIIKKGILKIKNG
ncbi:rhamnan synthesis F family protein [Streptococcus hillyeri]|uniref:Alpha-L-Rha alpha-1,3-L-rhamnosyltransferase n=1 Tax=Streptococcus hillyeri TaxID=2282420 RepID=A0A3L9DYS9_9STRE|nr:rhamnan synthesis F family protein [Streptococcus hillyeri]RLY05133.1 alpha-L-Rha alpha-1,3-L-rhamnosyltransferase [Streptococcus hillyeri]